MLRRSCDAEASSLTSTSTSASTSFSASLGAMSGAFLLFLAVGLDEAEVASPADGARTGWPSSGPDFRRRFLGCASSSSARSSSGGGGSSSTAPSLMRRLFLVADAFCLGLDALDLEPDGPGGRPRFRFGFAGSGAYKKVRTFHPYVNRY